SHTHCIFQHSRHLQHPPSFPTRRSSDLPTSRATRLGARKTSISSIGTTSTFKSVHCSRFVRTRRVWSVGDSGHRGPSFFFSKLFYGHRFTRRRYGVCM